MKTKNILLLIFIVVFFDATAQEFIPLWQKNKMPNSNSIIVKDSIVNNRYYKVGTPGMYAFFPSKDDNNGAAVLIFPGGGFSHITYNLSGFQLAKWFNSIGMSAFVVIYRLPNGANLLHRESAPLMDAQRALKIVRANAKEWGINKNKIGVQGSSAGAHLAAMMGTEESDLAIINDQYDSFSVKPAFMILVSPVIDMGINAHKGSKESLLGTNPSDVAVNKYSLQNNVTVNAPPCFIADAFNDKTVDPQNSLLFYKALLDKKVSTSFHVFPQGGHAININNNPGSTELWKALCEGWLKEMNFINFEKK